MSRSITEIHLLKIEDLNFKDWNLLEIQDMLREYSSEKYPDIIVKSDSYKNTMQVYEQTNHFFRPVGDETISEKYINELIYKLIKRHYE